MELALNISGLNKSIGKKQILNDVNMQVDFGEAMGLIGANGAGKSSLLKCIARLWHGDTGKITVCEKDVKKNFKAAMQYSGFLIEYPKMYGELTAIQNLKYISSYCNMKISDTDIENKLNLVGLNKSKEKKINTYSSGMYQRACIASLLMRNPKLLILDEPTAMLDPKSIVELRNILNSIKKNYNVSMLISSHNLHEVERMFLANRYISIFTFLLLLLQSRSLFLTF